MLLLALAVAAAAPQPGKLATFKDWVIGCDNIRSCQANALVPEGDDRDRYLMALVTRPAGRGAEAILSWSTEADLPRGPITLRIDGKDMAAVAKNAQIPLDPGLIAALANGRTLALTDGGGRIFASASLAGLAAALRYMDGQQKRAGGTTALVARDAAPASAVPAPLEAPLVSPAPLPRIAPVALPRGEVARLGRQFGCDTDTPGSNAPVEAVAIGPGTSLVLMPCGSGAYNASSVALVRRGGTFARATFDPPVGFGERGAPPMLVNADWDAKTARLGSYAKGRGLGDCGTTADFVWDGTRFRLVEQTEMSECRGSTDYIRTWTARTR